MPHSFDQLPGESHKAFAAFCEYLALGPQRSVDEAARKVGKSPGTLRKWSERLGWVKRAKDYDIHLIDVERATLEVATKGKAIEQLKRRQDLKEREFRIARLALEKLEEWLLKGPVVIKNPRDAAYLLEIASKVGRLSLEMPTEHQEVTGEDGGPVQVNVNIGDALKRVYGSGREAGPIIDVKDHDDRHDRSGADRALPERGESSGVPGGPDGTVSESGVGAPAAATAGERGRAGL